MKKAIARLLIPGIPYKTKYGGFGHCSISLISDGEDVILFDAGHYAVRGEILKILEKYKINKVFISHLHYDHCLNVDLFIDRGINVYVNRKEIEYLKKIRNDDIYTFKFFNKIINSKNLILFNKEFNISRNVRVLETHGHSVGHCSLAFQCGAKKYLVAGDAIKTYKDYENIKLADTKPYNYNQLIDTRRFIIDNFDVIIPGHSGIIEKGKKPLNKFIYFEF
jgi:glyoxylase-like metal-dependent hydrolase (beta-lactamase superfamily II)